MDFIQIYLVAIIAVLIEYSLCSVVKQCSLNTMCSCKSEDSSYMQHPDTELSCLGVPMAKLPDFPRAHMKVVAIVGSGLEVILADSFGDMKTDSLSLMSNNIVDIHDHAFMNMYNSLENLDISFNYLQEVPFAPIKTCEKLKVLNLESNEIAHLPVTWMQMKDTLASLYLGGNDLHNLPLHTDYSLSSFKNLTQVYLDRNFLTAIQGNALPFTLKLLSISDNLLAEIPFNVIENLADLSQLYLKNNYIEEISMTPFAKKRTFAALDLSYNLLRSVDNLFFRSVQVHDLNLQGNYIETVSPAIFNGVSCNKIDLSYNKLNSLPDRAFYGLENTLSYLDLSRNNFTKIPKTIHSLRHLKTLILDYNPLPSNYPDNVLKNSSQSIKSLSMAGTGLKLFPKNLLKSTKKLLLLNLSNNFIQDLEEDDFDKWGEHLETLILTSNNLKRLSDGTFKSLKSLEKLNLAYNELSTIEDRAFANLDRLTSLDLSYGLRTNNFPELALKSLAALLYLGLTGNNITRLPDTALYDFHYLQYLILDFNRISEVPENFFHPKVHRFLKDIRMSFNDLLSVAPNTFNGLEELQNVILNDNQIAFIHEGALKNLPNILKVALSNNRISKLTGQAFVNIPNLIQLDLQNNQLQEFSFNIFHNVTNPSQPMSINLSRNHIENIYASEVLTSIYLKNFDLSHNKLSYIPQNLMISITDSLRKLDLAHNLIRIIDNKDFSSAKSLEFLSLSNNRLITLKPQSFHGLNKLQILDLSSNYLDVLHPRQFENLHNLRILDLSFNALRSIPDDAFHNTKIEKLILKNNVFVLLPSAPFSDITYTLRVADFSHNQIEQLSRELFQSMASINEIDLRHNRLSHVQAHDFKNIKSLLRLSLSGNRLLNLNRQIFQQTQNLRYLDLADSNLHEIPILNIPNLVALNVSYNRLEVLLGDLLQGLPKLRHLDLSYNKLTSLGGVLWYHTPYLKSLNLSNNPIKILTKDSFAGLFNLNHLNVQKLYHLERFDHDTLLECKSLKSLHIQTWPRIEKYRFRLPRIVSNLKLLKHLSVLITEETLNDQLIQAFPRKLLSLEITGDDLKHIGENSLEGLENFKELDLRITGTKISHFPKRLFWNLRNNKFSLDLSSNNLHGVSPQIFYEKDGLQKYGTSIYSGGINLQDNPLRCDCNSIWFSDWMKRYLFESVKANFNQELEEDMKTIVCIPPAGESTKTPLLTYFRAGCQDVFINKANSLDLGESHTFFTVLIVLNYILFY